MKTLYAILLIIVFFSIGSISMAADNVRDLTCGTNSYAATITPPTARTDGSALPASAIDHYEILLGGQHHGNTVGNNTSYDIDLTGFACGQSYRFTGITWDINTLSSIESPDGLVLNLGNARPLPPAIN